MKAVFMRRLIAVFFAGLLVFSFSMPLALAEDDDLRVAAARRLTLFDLLFGKKNQAAPTPPRSTRTTTTRRTPSVQQLPAAVPEVEKIDGATRMVVFGDSLAVDLSKALGRFYAEDPNLSVINQGVGSSGFVRDDFFDWPGALEKAIADDSFDIAVVIVGINDRQSLRSDGKNLKALTDTWRTLYSARVAGFLQQLQEAGKPVVWVGLPPMKARSYSAAMAEISAIHRLAAFAGGAEFVDIYERFLDENDAYSSYGPDLNGQNALMRKSNGIHFARAGLDKLAFYVNQSVKVYYRGGTVSIEIADALAGTEAAAMKRPPYQGLGQIRLLEVAGAVLVLDAAPRRAAGLVLAASEETRASPVDLAHLVLAPKGRVDAFGVGIDLAAAADRQTEAVQ